MRWPAIAFVMACGGREAAAPDLRNTTLERNEPTPRVESKRCRDAIEAWYFAAGITPRTHDNEPTVQARQRTFIDACDQDGWSSQASSCFEHLRVSVGRDAVSALSDCKAMLTPAQLAGYKRGIEQTGDTDLDKLE